MSSNFDFKDLDKVVVAYKEGRYRAASSECKRVLEAQIEKDGSDANCYVIYLLLTDLYLLLADFNWCQKYLAKSNQCANKEVDRDLSDALCAFIDLYCVEARLLCAESNFTKAEFVARELHAQAREKFGLDSLQHANALNTLGRILIHCDKAEEAQPLLRRAMTMRERLAGIDSVGFAESLNSMGNCYSRLDNSTSALAILTKSLSEYRKLLRADHPQIGVALCDLGEQELREQKAENAERHFEEALKISENELPEYHPQHCVALNGLAAALLAQKCFRASRDYFEKSLEVASHLQVSNDLLLLSAHSGLSFSLIGLLQFAQAEPHTKKALFLVENSAQLQAAAEKGLLDRLMVCYVLQGKLVDAMRLYPDSMRSGHTTQFQNFVNMMGAIGNFLKKQLPPVDPV